MCDNDVDVYGELLEFFKVCQSLLDKDQFARVKELLEMVRERFERAE